MCVFDVNLLMILLSELCCCLVSTWLIPCCILLVESITEPGGAIMIVFFVGFINLCSMVSITTIIRRRSHICIDDGKGKRYACTHAFKIYIFLIKDNYVITSQS